MTGLFRASQASAAQSAIHAILRVRCSPFITYFSPPIAYEQLHYIIKSDFRIDLKASIIPSFPWSSIILIKKMINMNSFAASALSGIVTKLWWSERNDIEILPTSRDLLLPGFDIGVELPAPAEVEHPADDEAYGEAEQAVPPDDAIPEERRVLEQIG